VEWFSIWLNGLRPWLSIFILHLPYTVLGRILALLLSQKFLLGPKLNSSEFFCENPLVGMEWLLMCGLHLWLYFFTLFLSYISNSKRIALSLILNFLLVSFMNYNDFYYPWNLPLADILEDMLWCRMPSFCIYCIFFWLKCTEQNLCHNVTEINKNKELGHWYK
jgi:hypothetical protein